MAGWRVALEGEPFDLRYLFDQFQAGTVRIEKDGSAYYLVDDEFASMSDSTPVHKRAQAVLSILNGAATIADSSHRPVALASVQFIDPRSNVNSYVHLTSTIEARARVGAVLVSTTPSAQPLPRPTPDAVKWAAYALTDDRAARILRYLQKRKDWVSLYKILEEIEEDMGGSKAIQQAGWASETAMGRFTATANNRLAIGDDARHSTSKFQLPKRPMTPSEAEALIRRIAESWFRLNCP
jgi:hypothetical protein